MKQRKICSTTEYKSIYAHNRRIVTRSLTVLYDASPASEFAWGITVSKKIGNAVQRNKVKRRIKAFIREYKFFHELPLKVVFIARKGAFAVGWADISQQLSGIMTRLQSAIVK